MSLVLYNNRSAYVEVVGEQWLSVFGSQQIQLAAIQSGSNAGLVSSVMSVTPLFDGTIGVGFDLVSLTGDCTVQVTANQSSGSAMSTTIALTGSTPQFFGAVAEDDAIVSVTVIDDRLAGQPVLTSVTAFWNGQFPTAMTSIENVIIGAVTGSGVRVGGPPFSDFEKLYPDASALDASTTIAPSGWSVLPAPLSDTNSADYFPAGDFPAGLTLDTDDSSGLRIDNAPNTPGIAAASGASDISAAFTPPVPGVALDLIEYGGTSHPIELTLTGASGWSQKLTVQIAPLGTASLTFVVSDAIAEVSMTRSTNFAGAFGIQQLLFEPASS
jgi:hypothetical protein